MRQENLIAKKNFQTWIQDASTAEVEKSPLSERWEHLERNQVGNIRLKYHFAL